jgi:GAF domain-containing protein
MNASPIPAVLQNGVASRLQDFVLETSDAEEFFEELAVFSASLLAPPGSEVYCNVIVVRHEKPVTVASSSPWARKMDELQYAFGDGPCLSAMRTGATMHVPDVAQEPRWPEYARAVITHGVRSILSVPLPLEGESSAALNVYSSRAHGFSGEDLSRAELFGEQSAKILRLELRLAQLQDAKNNLDAAMKSRTAIDIAVGIIMGSEPMQPGIGGVHPEKSFRLPPHQIAGPSRGIIESIYPGTHLRTHFV